MSNELTFFDRAAQHKLKLSEEWRCALISTTDDGQFLIEIGPTHVKTRGKYKGQLAWSKEKKTICLTRKDLDAAEKRYEKATNNCAKCTGSGKRIQSWSKFDGYTYRECDNCQGSGKRVKFTLAQLSASISS